MTDKCQYCGLIHEAKCPNVKAIEYHPDGTVKRVEFFAPNDYGPKLAGWDPNVFPPLISFAQDVPMRWSSTEGWQRVDRRTHHGYQLHSHRCRHRPVRHGRRRRAGPHRLRLGWLGLLGAFDGRVMFGLNLTAWLAIACAVLGVIVIAEGIAVKAAWDSETAALDRLTTVTANRDALSRDNDKLAGVIERQQREADAADAKAKAALSSQQAAASKIRVELRDAKDQTTTLIQQIQDARHVRPTVVSQTVTDGFDPLIHVGLERLKCVQRARNRGEAGDGCRVPLPTDTGGAGASGGPDRAGDYRPGFDTQLRMLNDLWRLHDWGASCYSDKRAIAASQP
jgi:hypothetical protein